MAKLKNIKPLIFYIPLTFILFILLFVISKGSISETFSYFNRYYVYFNIVFASLYFFINNVDNLFSLILLSLFSLLFTVINLEIIYPNSLSNNVNLFDKKDTVNIPVEKNEKDNEIIEVPLDYLERANYYLSIGENSSAYIYADSFLERDSNNFEARKIKSEAEEQLRNRGVVSNDPKYIETLKYKNMILQNRFLDAYYFSLNHTNNIVYDYDFSIKLSNSYEVLLNNFYSINIVESIINKPGYSNIKFYYTKSSVNLYSIEKLVEYENEYYIKNLRIGYNLYPYIFINRDGKIFSKGFNEIKREVFIHPLPEIPMDPSLLKLYSSELYALSYSSLHFNLKLFNIKNINYFKENILVDQILTRITGYCTIFIIFFMVILFDNKKNYINTLFVYTAIIFTAMWYIKKIGLILIYYGISLSLIWVILCYLIWLIIIMKKTNRQLSLF